MSMYMPGSFFIGALTPVQQGYIKTILKNAKKEGYTRVVEPCAGAFAMAHLAVQAGFKPEQIETSDITLFSTIYGYAIMGKPLDELNITADGFTKKQLKDPATALYAIMLLKTVTSAGSDYFYSMVKDLEIRKNHHVQFIQKQIDFAKEQLNGINYRALDMGAHMVEVENDEKTIMIVNPPTYKAGYEKWFDTKGQVNWNEPEYSIFDPDSGIHEMMNHVSDKKAIVLCYEEATQGNYSGIPVHVRCGVRGDINVYITTNKPDQVLKLSGKRGIERKLAKELKPINYSVISKNAILTDESDIQVRGITPQEAYYYRALWMNKFVGSSAQVNAAMFIDGKISGVFGYQLVIGKTLERVSIWYGVAKKINNYRTNRLLTMVATNQEVIEQFVPEHKLKMYNGVTTSNLTKYPESKIMRGIMTLVERKKGALGFTLVYECDFQNRTNKETIKEFLKKEVEWKNKNQPKAKAKKVRR